MNHCERCDRDYSRPPAMSRLGGPASKDDHGPLMICPDCGMDEAVFGVVDRYSWPVKGKVLVVTVPPIGDVTASMVDPDDAGWFQAQIGGWMEAHSFPNGGMFICNEDGARMGLPPNDRITRRAITFGLNVVGTCVIVGDPQGESFSSAPEWAFGL